MLLITRACCLTETLAPITTSAPSTQPFAEQTELASTNMGATGWEQRQILCVRCSSKPQLVCQTKSYKNDIFSRCNCQRGFQVDESTGICVDVDECGSGMDAKAITFRLHFSQIFVTSSKSHLSTKECLPTR